PKYIKGACLFEWSAHLLHDPMVVSCHKTPLQSQSLSRRAGVAPPTTKTNGKDKIKTSKKLPPKLPKQEVTWRVPCAGTARRRSFHNPLSANTAAAERASLAPPLPAPASRRHRERLLLALMPLTALLLSRLHSEHRRNPSTLAIFATTDTCLGGCYTVGPTAAAITL
ncbi:unnamed protein product, partial [Ectocarpus sp. 6 AP-2014]